MQKVWPVIWWIYPAQLARFAQLRCLSERQFLRLPAHTKYSFWLELYHLKIKMACKCRAHYILVCSIIACLGSRQAPIYVIMFIKSSKFLKSIHFLFICYASVVKTAFMCIALHVNQKDRIEQNIPLLFWR